MSSLLLYAMHHTFPINLRTRAFITSPVPGFQFRGRDQNYYRLSFVVSLPYVGLELNLRGGGVWPHSMFSARSLGEIANISGTIRLRSSYGFPRDFISDRPLRIVFG